MYIEKRSAHALRIDRAKKAREVHKDFNSEYSQAPNQSDVVHYDDVGVRIPPNAPKPQETEQNKHYEPTDEEIRKAHRILLKQDPITIYKDLTTTRNVVTKKNGFNTWKKNPKFYDLHGVDTQLNDLIDNRIDTIQKIVQTPIKYTNRSHRRYMGVFKHRLTASDRGEITIYNKNIPTTDKKQQVLAHELGHAYDNNILSRKNKSLFVNMVGNVDFLNPKYPKNRQKVLGVVKKVNFWDEGVSSSFDRYRRSSSEMFADWFSAVITNKNYAKKHSKQAYSNFKHQNKDLFSALKESDTDTIKRYLAKISTNKKI